MSQYLMNNYARLPVTFHHGRGAWLYDDAGNEYLDALSGIAVCGLGHAHPELNKVISAQANKLWHVSNIFDITQQNKVAETLCGLSKMDKAFFCNSGTEANEAAIKLSRLHARTKGIEQPIVLSFTNSFHGRTFASMSATGSEKVQHGFAPLVPGFKHLPYNDIAALQAMSGNANVVAVIVECIQGEGGINIIDEDFISLIRTLCDDNDWLMIIDDIQAGIGRTGEWFSYQHYDLVPDVLTLAKGLGNGLPVGACLAKGKAATLFQAGNHGTTFGGSPLVMAVVDKVLAIYQRDNIPSHALRIGDYLQQKLSDVISDHPYVHSIRGKGMMIGIELKQQITNLAAKAIDDGLIINVTAGKVIRLLPALTLSEHEADMIVARLKVLLNKT